MTFQSHDFLSPQNMMLEKLKNKCMQENLTQVLMVNMYIHQDRSIISNLDKNFDIVQLGRLDEDSKQWEEKPGKLILRESFLQVDEKR